MHIFRGIRMVVVRMMMRATCHCKVRVTCFPEGGVPTRSTTTKYKNDPEINKIRHVIHIVQPKLTSNVEQTRYEKYINQSKQETHLQSLSFPVIFFSKLSCSSRMSYPLSYPLKISLEPATKSRPSPSVFPLKILLKHAPLLPLQNISPPPNRIRSSKSSKTNQEYSIIRVIL